MFLRAVEFVDRAICDTDQLLVELQPPEGTTELPTCPVCLGVWCGEQHNSYCVSKLIYFSHYDLSRTHGRQRDGTAYYCM